MANAAACRDRDSCGDPRLLVEIAMDNDRSVAMSGDASESAATAKPRFSNAPGRSSRPAGLLVRVDRPINKDTELHPLVRWQFLGGIPEDERRAFLFTNVVDSHGRRYDIPVVVGALAASRENLCDGHGLRASKKSARPGLHAIANPIPPVLVSSPRLPGSGDSGRRSAASPAAAWPACRCRSPRRASTPRLISPRRSASRAIPKPACATWARIAAR